MAMSDRPWFDDPTTILGELRLGSHLRDSAPPRIPGYDEWSEIGRGGQGVVYAAVQKSTSREVAIKVLHEGPVATGRRRIRFEREIEAVSALQHPGVVRVYDSGITEDGRLYLVMEHLEGVALDRKIDSLGDPLDTVVRQEILGLMLGVVEAVEHAHGRGVIHRDLKPGNVIVDGAGDPHILDFGIARLVEEESGATQEGQFVGTLATASPEQISGDPAAIDVRTDVYALGVLLFRAITGTLPHSERSTPLETMRAITEEDPEPPSRRLARERGIRPPRRATDLDAVVLRALAREPARRYPSAGALAEDLRRVLDGRPIEARLDDFGYVLRKTLARHRLEAVLAASIILAILASAITAGLLARRTSLEIAKAEQIRVFLEDTFGSVEPRRPGEPVTMAETLDEAVHWVKIALSDEPEVAASLRHTIGNSYRAIGRYEDAETQLTLALEGRRRAHGGDRHLEVAQTLNGFGLLRRDQGRLDEAEAFFRQGLEIRKDLLGSRHAAVASSLVNLARLRLARNDTDEAGRLLEDALAIRLEQREPGHPDIAMMQFDLARVAEARGDRSAAIGLQETVLAARLDHLHPDHPDIARSRLVLARLHLEAGGHETALAHARACYQARLAFLGPDDDRTTEAEGWFGAVQFRMGETEEGRARLLRAQSVLVSRRGKEAEMLRGLLPYIDEASAP